VGCSASSGPRDEDPYAGGGAHGGTTAGTTASGAGTSGGDPGAGGGCGAGPGTGGAAGSVAGSGGSGAEPGSDITFDWPETDPSQKLSCKAGHYLGAFNGIYTSPATFVGVPVPVSGNVDLWLAESANGEFFEIADGKVSGVADFVFPFSADLKGELNCVTSKLENGQLENGQYVAFGVTYAFSGPVDAGYDKLTSAFVNGTWNVKEQNPVFGGSGTWTASWTP
jgi:hypothetical protein